MSSLVQANAIGHVGWSKNIVTVELKFAFCDFFSHPELKHHMQVKINAHWEQV